MANTIYQPKPVFGHRIRITRNDAVGAAVAGTTAKSRYVAKGFIRLDFQPDMEPGAQITRKNASGELCMNRKEPDRVKGWNLTLALCGMDVIAMEMLAGLKHLVLSTDTVGGVWPGYEADLSFTTQLEVWAENDDAPAAAQKYVQHLFPKTYNWQLAQGGMVGSDGMDIVLSGYAETNPNWTASETGEWDAGWTTDIKAGAGWAWRLTDTLPTVSGAAYEPADT